MNIGIIIAVILTMAVAVPVTWYITSSNHRKQDEIKVDSADAKADLHPGIGERRFTILIALVLVQAHAQFQGNLLLGEPKLQSPIS